MKGKKLILKTLAVVVAICMLQSVAWTVDAGQSNPDDFGITLDPMTSCYSTTYKENLETKTDWREGMVTGNGEIAVVESCNPVNDVLIFQNTKFNSPNDDYFDTPELAPVLDKMRQATLTLTEGSVWKIAEAQANKSFSWTKWDYGYDYSFHPGPQMRLEIPASGDVSNYKRWTNYETAEIGVQYSDDDSYWLRRTFASRKDNVIITYITKKSKNGSSDNSKINMTISIDEMSTMQKESKEVPNIQYKILVPDDASYIAQVAHYPTLQNSLLNDGGYAGVTKVITSGGTQTKITLPITDTTRNVGENAGIQINDADSVILITTLDRDVNMGKLSDFKSASEYSLVTRLLNEISEVQKKYKKDNFFDYDSALNEHVALHAVQFDRVRIDLNGDPEDRKLSNEELLAKQRANPDTLNKALLERIYYAGRYALICASGYSTTRLGGIWTGAWNPDWQGDYTTDANLNLQIAGVNTGNMKESAWGYISFILRTVKDWEYNAKRIYGIDNAIMAPGRTDGETGYIYHINAGNPFFCWNAGADWLLMPIFEYWQCYGNDSIPLGEDINVDELKSVLDLSDERIKEIKANKCFDLEKDILLPLLEKEANFWEGFVDPRYYMDVNGEVHYDENHLTLAEGEKYLFIPSYSPENHPRKPYEDVIQINATMDISAARNCMDMVTVMEKAVKGKADPKWQELKEKFPDYGYHEDTGDLREWSYYVYTESYGHRHISHLYCAWPAFETQYNEELRKGAEIAMELKNANTTASSKQGHGWMHNGLIQARLKNSEGVIGALKPGLTGYVYYTSLMTAHNVDGSSAYCTDTACATPAIINEALLFSNANEIEILPALPLDWDKGSIKGLMARTQAEIQELSWDKEKKTATVKIKSNVDQTINLRCGISWQDAEIKGISADSIINKNQNIILTVKEGETAEITFDIPEFKQNVDNSYNFNKINTSNNTNTYEYNLTGAINNEGDQDDTDNDTDIDTVVTFNDIKNHWAKEAIEYMASRGIISGVGNNMFEPDRAITRAEFAAVVVRALGLKSGSGSISFNDVKSSDWYYDYVKAAADNQIISGYEDGSFRPMENITREQAMSIIARALSVSGLNVELTGDEADKLLSGFTDGDKAADYARNGIAVCVKLGIVTGRNGNMIAPKDNITRAEVAVIMKNLLDKIG